MLLSRYFYIKNDKNHWDFKNLQNLDFENGFIHSINSAHPEDNIPVYIYYKKWIEEWQKNYKKHDVLLLKYEDLVFNEKEFCKKVLDYINCSDIKLDKFLSRISNFKNSDAKKRWRRFGYLKYTYRKGIINEHKKFLLQKSINL